jgi:asparagine synthase (glutamine-hydrolysing)
MCGIGGFTRNRFRDDPLPDLRRMRERLRHRGPDAQTEYIDPGIALAHTRLAVVDLEGGAQPRTEIDGRALTYNGEIYGFARLAENLRRDGIALRDHSDTEVLFQMLSRQGPEATLRQIDGMFAFAYRDAAGDVWLARDRFGEKPLYYALVDGDLYFASELGALRTHCRIAALPWREGALRLFLQLQYLPAGETGIAGIRQLEPGCLLRFRDGGIQTFRYWAHPGNQPGPDAPATIDEATDRLESSLDRSVAERLIADVPVGILLSGGLDSSLVAAFVRRHKPHLKSFNIRFPDASFDESPHAAAVAAHLGLDHHTINCDDEAIAGAFGEVIGRLDMLLADASILPTYLLSRETRKHVTVALGGDGADELFLGYPNFAVRRYAGVMSRIPEFMGNQLREALRHLPGSDSYMNLPFRLRQLSFGFGKPADAQSLYWMTGLGPEERMEIWPDEAMEESLEADIAAFATHGWGPEPADDVERLSRQFIRGYLPDSVLAKVDRASMLHALEVRTPFLSREVAEFAMGLDPDFKLGGTSGKRVLRTLASRHLPADVTTRRKHGFSVPLARLFRTGLRSQAETLLLETNGPLAGAIHRPALEELLRAHMSGKRDNSRQIWTLCVLMAVTQRT